MIQSFPNAVTVNQAYIDSLPVRRSLKAKGWTPIKSQPCPLLFKCYSCNELLPVSSFYKYNKKSRSGRKDIFGNSFCSTCKSCGIKTYTSKSPEAKLLQSAKKRAKDKGFYFGITLEDIEIPEYCPVLGVKLKGTVGQGTQAGGSIPNSPTLDRLDNSEGYTPENIRVISHRANTVKSNSTLEELEAVIEYMRRELAIKANAEKCGSTTDTTIDGEVTV